MSLAEFDCVNGLREYIFVCDYQFPRSHKNHRVKYVNNCFAILFPSSKHLSFFLFRYLYTVSKSINLLRQLLINFDKEIELF